MYNLFMSNKTRRLVIIRGDDFDIGFAGYQSDTRFDGIRTVLNTRDSTVGETNIPYRVINHWDEQGLLPDGAAGNDGGWRRFTLTELVWLHVANRLRGFGLSLEKIRRAKTDVMEWNKEHERYLRFEYYLAKALFSKLNPYVYVLDDGEAAIASSGEFEMSNNMSGNLDVLMISLKSVLEEMGHKTLKPEMLLSVSEDEIALLHASRREDVNEVSAKIEPNGKFKEFETTKVDPNPPTLNEITRQSEREKLHGKVILQYQDGVLQSSKMIKRRRL